MNASVLYLVLGGELTSLDHRHFADLQRVDLVGLFDNYEEAQAIWKAKAQQTIDQAHVRYFVVPLHEFMNSLSS